MFVDVTGWNCLYGKIFTKVFAFSSLRIFVVYKKNDNSLRFWCLKHFIRLKDLVKQMKFTLHPNKILRNSNTNTNNTNLFWYFISDIASQLWLPTETTEGTECNWK